MDDLLSGTRIPETFEAGGIFSSGPVFFAIYPAAEDVPRVVDWLEGVRRQYAPMVELRPPELLHVSVAECGRPKRQRQALADAFAEARRHFSFPAFDIAFNAIARFGKDGRACVACADVAGQEAVQGLRIALADAQRHAGLFISRGSQDAHLTMGYGTGLPAERRGIPPFGFRVCAVDLVVSRTGRSIHRHLQRWSLD